MSPNPSLRSGAAMDRLLPRPSRLRRAAPWVVGALLLALLSWGLVQALPKGRSVTRAELQLAAAREGLFKDEMLLRARVVPQRSVLLDATESGRVEEVLVRDGTTVAAGALLYRLSNPQREQELLARSAELAQQMANVALQRSALASSRAQLRRDLTQLEHDQDKARSELDRQQTLATAGFISSAALEDAQRQLHLRQRLLSQARDDGEAETRTRERSIDELEHAVQGLAQGLALQRDAALHLAARAPIGGLLSGFTLQQGGSVRGGDKLGRIDDASGFKLGADVDEFYLPRIEEGLQASLTDEHGKTWPLQLSRRLPQVQDGRFQVEFSFAGAAPSSLHAGQSLELRLSLGHPGQALLLPDGPWVQDGGGSVAYVLTKDGRGAERRAIRIGRRSGGQVELLAGIAAGETALISPLQAYGDAAFLQLK